MPSFVSPARCTGCGSCVAICPGSLMALDAPGGRALCREPDACWECYACVKNCPQQAVRVRGYADFVPLGAECAPVVAPGSIHWTVTFRNGEQKQFRFVTRTGPGQYQPDALAGRSLDDNLLSTETALPQPENPKNEPVRVAGHDCRHVWPALNSPAQAGQNHSDLID